MHTKKNYPREALMPALTLDEQLIFDVAVALKKVKSLVFEGKWLRKAVLRSPKPSFST